MGFTWQPMLEQSEVQSRLHVNFVKYDPKFDLGKPKKKKNQAFMH